MTFEPMHYISRDRLYTQLLTPEQFIVIGDTPADIECGRSLGVRAIGVATGSYTVDELLRCGAYAAFETLADTDRVVRTIVDA